MKFTTSKKIDDSLIGERLLREYSYTDSTGESNDGMRRGFSYCVNCKLYGIVENEIRNEDGTYTYDYSSRVIKDQDQYGDGFKKPDISEYDLKEMVKELMFQYNINEFSTDLQEKPNSIKDYYVKINARSNYIKDKETQFSYNSSISSKDNEDYTKPDNYVWTSYERIRTESMDDLNKQINSSFSKDDYILYLMGHNIEKDYDIILGLDEIKEDETVNSFLDSISVETPSISNLESALKENLISIEDVKNTILKYKNLNGMEISHSILEQLFENDKELISHFTQQKLPLDILRKYNPEFDIKKIMPNDLLPSDLDKVLQNVIQKSSILGTYPGPSEDELKNGYLEYLKGFLNDKEALKKIIPVINTAHECFFVMKSKEFVDSIPEEVMSKSEIQDLILNIDNIGTYEVLSYDFPRDDENYARKLLEIFGRDKTQKGFRQLNGVLKVAIQNGISDDDILQSLRDNDFSISPPGFEDIIEFEKIGFSGIKIDDIQNAIMRKKSFKYLKLLKNIDENEIGKKYKDILKGLSKNSGMKRNKDYDYKEEIFELISDYYDTYELFSKLPKDDKNMTKKIVIQNLDNEEIIEHDDYNLDDKIKKVIREIRYMGITEDEFTSIYMKCLNNGMNTDKSFDIIESCIPKENKEKLKEKLENSNIYPAPKYFWLRDRDLKRISINKAKDNRASIKEKIQKDGRCFSTMVKTDLEGVSKDGKKIPINNLSKWLFGVPGARGHLTVTKAGDCVQLPSNTPDETVELIKGILKERKIEDEIR